MGEARRRRMQSESLNSARAIDAADGLPAGQDMFLRSLSRWNDAHPWAAPAAEEHALPSTEVFLYLVDTLSLWNVVAGAPEHAVAQLFALADGAPASLYQRAPGLAGVSLAKASAEGATLADSSCQNALTFAGFYLACTETRAQAVEHTGSTRGHWFVLHYHLNNGSEHLRPFYMATPERRKLGASSFVSAVVDVMAKDVHSRTSQLSSRIRDAGGLRMAEALKGRVTPQVPR
jgi:hypothetical protein